MAQDAEQQVEVTRLFL